MTTPNQAPKLITVEDIPKPNPNPVATAEALGDATVRVLRSNDELDEGWTKTGERPGPDGRPVVSLSKDGVGTKDVYKDEFDRANDRTTVKAKIHGLPVESPGLVVSRVTNPNDETVTEYSLPVGDKNMPHYIRTGEIKDSRVYSAKAEGSQAANS